METNLWARLDWTNWGRKTHPWCEENPNPSMVEDGGHPKMDEKEKLAEDQHLSLPASWVYNVTGCPMFLPPLWLHQDGLPLQLWSKRTLPCLRIFFVRASPKAAHWVSHITALQVKARWHSATHTGSREGLQVRVEQKSSRLECPLPVMHPSMTFSSHPAPRIHPYMPLCLMDAVRKATKQICLVSLGMEVMS